MKKNSLALKALIGVQMGFAFISANGVDQTSDQTRKFYEQLDPYAKDMFNELDSEHKRRAMGIVDQYCRAVQECKGHREQSVERQYYLQKSGRI